MEEMRKYGTCSKDLKVFLCNGGFKKCFKNAPLCCRPMKWFHSVFQVEFVSGTSKENKMDGHIGTKHKMQLFKTDTTDKNPRQKVCGA